MFTVYFNYDKENNLFSYEEGNYQYEMSFRLMLMFKKYIRENLLPTSEKPVRKWIDSLSEDLAQQVKIIEPHQH